MLKYQLWQAENVKGKKVIYLHVGLCGFSTIAVVFSRSVCTLQQPAEMIHLPAQPVEMDFKVHGNLSEMVAQTEGLL